MRLGLRIGWCAVAARVDVGAAAWQQHAIYAGQKGVHVDRVVEGRQNQRYSAKSVDHGRQVRLRRRVPDVAVERFGVGGDEDDGRLSKRVAHAISTAPEARPGATKYWQS